jgi:hypothetical protein
LRQTIFHSTLLFSKTQAANQHTKKETKVKSPHTHNIWIDRLMNDRSNIYMYDKIDNVIDVTCHYYPSIYQTITINYLSQQYVHHVLLSHNIIFIYHKSPPSMIT